MNLRPILAPPLTYLITAGLTKPNTTETSAEFTRILDLVKRAVAAHISLVQIREKQLSARALYELSARAAAITANSNTRLLVNDRADIARAARADGVHLTTRSLATDDVRRICGPHFLIGVSTHSLSEAQTARIAGADFATYGPVYETPAKAVYGAAPVGVAALREAAQALRPFPLIALGGIAIENLCAVWRAGARGVAAIRLFDAASDLTATTDAIARTYHQATHEMPKG